LLNYKKIAIAIALTFLFSVFVLNSSAPQTHGEAPFSNYTGTGNSFDVVKRLDFHQDKVHHSVYEDVIYPDEKFPMDYNAKGASLIRATGIVTCAENAIAETSFSTWEMAAGWSAAQEGYIRFYSSSVGSFTSTAYKSFKVGYDPDLISSMVLYWDCYRVSAGGYAPTGSYYRGGGKESPPAYNCVGDNSVNQWNARMVQKVNLPYGRNRITKVQFYGMRVYWPSDLGGWYIALSTDVQSTNWIWSTSFDPQGIPSDRFSWISFDVPNVLVESSYVYIVVGYGGGTTNNNYREDLVWIFWGNLADTNEGYWWFFMGNWGQPNGNGVGAYLALYGYGEYWINGNYESVSFTDSEGTVSNVFHTDNTGSDAGWHTFSWDLSSRIPYLAPQVKIAFEASHNAYATSEFRIDNIYFRITLNKVKAIYRDTNINLSDGLWHPILYTTGPIALRGCDFTTEFSAQLENSSKNLIHKFSATNGSNIIHELSVPITKPIGGCGYSNYRVEVINIPADYSLNSIFCPEVKVHDISSSVPFSIGSLTIPSEIIAQHGYGIYKIICTSPNCVVETETWIGDRSLKSDYFMRGDSLQLKTIFSTYGNYCISIYDPLGTNIFNQSGATLEPIGVWTNSCLHISASALLGKYVQQVTFNNGFEQGFRQHVFYVDSNEAEMQWSGDVDKITLAGSVKNTRTLSAARSINGYALLLDTSHLSSPVNVAYNYTENSSCYIKSVRISSNVLTSYDVAIDVDVSAPPGIVGIWPVRVQFEIGNNPTGSITCYYDHILSTNDAFTYEIRLIGGSIIFTNSTLASSGPIVSNGTAWCNLYNKRMPTYYEVFIKLMDGKDGSSQIIDQKLERLFITGINGKLLGVTPLKPDENGYFSVIIDKPKLVIPGDTMVVLMGVDGNGIPVKPPSTEVIRTRALYVDPNSISTNGRYDDATVKARLRYEDYEWVGAGVKCQIDVAGVNYAVETDSMGYVTVTNVQLPNGRDSIRISTSIVDDQTHSALENSLRWITDEASSINYTLGIERTTLTNFKFSLNDHLVNPDQRITATFSMRSAAFYVKLHLFCKVIVSGKSWIKDLWIDPGAINTIREEFTAPMSIGLNCPVTAYIGYNDSEFSCGKFNESVEVTGIKIDQTTITPSGIVNVGDVVTVKIHAVWAHNNSMIKGAIINMEDVSEAFTDNEGWAYFNVSRNTAGTYKFKSYGVSAPDDITFRVNEITSEVAWVDAPKQSATKEVQPQLTFAATISILSSIVILAFRRRAKPSPLSVSSRPNLFV